MSEYDNQRSDMHLLVWERSESPNRLPLERLVHTAEWKALTKKQRICIATYISNNYDIINAIRTAYPCQNDKIAGIMQHNFFASNAVTMVLCRHFGTDPKEIFLQRLVRMIIKGKIDNNTIRAYELYAKVNNWVTTPVMEAARIAQQMGFSRRKGTPKLDNVKQTIKAAIKQVKHKQEAKEDPADGFDLSSYESVVEGE